MSTALPFPRAMPTNNEGIVFKQKLDPNESMVARNGDWLCSLFQCDHCWFQNLTLCNPESSSPSNNILLDHVRQFNLDICWARAQSNVSTVVSGMKKGICLSSDLGLLPPYPPQ
eukprot:1214834-Ditylum_brightwellii.AAC.1